MNKVKIKIGDKVRYFGSEERNQFPQYYPPTGTVGTIVEVDENGTSLVDWGKVGMVLPPYSWWCENKLVELISEG